MGHPLRTYHRRHLLFWATPLCIFLFFRFPYIVWRCNRRRSSWDVVRSLPILEFDLTLFHAGRCNVVSPVMPVAMTSSSESASLSELNIDSNVFPVGKLPPSGIGSTTMGAVFCKLESLLGGLQSLFCVVRDAGQWSPFFRICRWVRR